MVRTFSYKQVEPVLARVLGVRPENLASLSARIMHLKRLGLTPAKPGRGVPIAYSREDILRWALFLQLERTSLAPAAARNLGERIWTAMSKVLLGSAAEPRGDWLVFIFPDMIAPPLVAAEENLRTSFVAGLASDFETFQAQHLSLVVLNASALRRAVDMAIDELADAAAPRRGIPREVAGKAPASVPKPARRPARKNGSVMA